MPMIFAITPPKEGTLPIGVLDRFKEQDIGENYGNNDGAVIKIGSWGGMFTLKGFTIQNGNDDYVGGGLSLGRSSNDFGTVNITNNIFKDNHSDYGGAYFAWSANGTINRNLFIGNTATYRANAAYLRDYRSVIGLKYSFFVSL